MAPTKYHISPTGSDGNPGTKAQPWKTLAKASAAKLNPGDKLLLKRGGTWSETLHASWFGENGYPITIGAYGSGLRPVIRNPTGAKGHINVKITGSHLQIENLETTIVGPPVQPDCLNNPLGWFVGFNFEDDLPDGGSNNVLRYCKATRHTAGAHTQLGTRGNQITNCEFIENNAMKTLTPTGETDDIGAWGCLIRGDNHRIGHNYFHKNNALCGFDTLPQGNSVELYQAKNCIVHHNTSIEDRVFSELGSGEGVESENNVFAFNLVSSSIVDAKFITTRGPTAPFGPVYGTILYRNTVYLTGALSQAFNCWGGCSPAMLTASGNIFVAGWKAGSADGKFIESHNIYWKKGGNPFVQFVGFAMHSTSKKADPMFVNPDAGDFHLKAGSPAIDTGIDVGWLVDLDEVTVPQGVGYDRGAFEYVA